MLETSVRRSILASLLASLLAAVFGFGPAAAQSFQATSTTAMSITGDIVVSPSKITFANGASLSLKPAGADRPGIFRVSPPSNPELLNGNTLCGLNPPSFVVFANPDGAPNLVNASSLYLKVYDGEEPPPASAILGLDMPGEGVCALYNFER